jgi:hypothetical protein
MRDMARKGRKPIYAGERNGAAKLDEHQVQLVRAAHAAGYTQEHIAGAACVSRRLVGMIVNRQRWSHVP